MSYARRRLLGNYILDNGSAMAQVQKREADVEKIEVTPEMTKAGADRLRWLIEAETGSEYAAEEVYRAMVRAAPRRVCYSE